MSKDGNDSTEKENHPEQSWAMSDNKHDDNDHNQNHDHEEEIRSSLTLKSRQRPEASKLSGYLLKLKHKPTMFGSWNKRYFHVDPSTETLSYYTSDKDVSSLQTLQTETDSSNNKSTADTDSAPRKVFKLSNILNVHSVDNFSFQIIFKGSEETVMLLRATSYEEKMRWVHHLHLFVQELTAYEIWLSISKLAHPPHIREYSGFLHKLKRTPSTYSSWNKRFFKINANDKTLEYFKSPKDLKDARVIKLKHIMEVRIIDPWTFQLEIKESTSADASQSNTVPKLRKEWSKQLQSGNMHYFCLQAESKKEQIEWRTRLEQYVHDLKKYQSIRDLEQRSLSPRTLSIDELNLELEQAINIVTYDTSV